MVKYLMKNVQNPPQNPPQNRQRLNRTQQVEVNSKSPKMLTPQELAHLLNLPRNEKSLFDRINFKYFIRQKLQFEAVIMIAILCRAEENQKVKLCLWWVGRRMKSAIEVKIIDSDNKVGIWAIQPTCWAILGTWKFALILRDSLTKTTSSRTNLPPTLPIKYISSSSSSPTTRSTRPESTPKPTRKSWNSTKLSSSIGPTKTSLYKVE